MTTSEFLQMHFNSQVAVAGVGRINVNLTKKPDATLGGLRTTLPWYVTAISVNTKAGSVDNQISVDLDNVLRLVEQIRFVFNNREYTLEVINRATYYPGGTYPTFFFVVTPFEIPGSVGDFLTNGQLQDDTLIDFTPFLQDLESYLRDYSVLLNNASKIRASYKIRQSERRKTATIPSNWQSIYEGSAELANIQDSVYYDTGWINGRYAGSKSTPKNYGGVAPSLSGKSFQGQIYTDNTSQDYICDSPYDVRVFQELFHTGKTKQPTYTTSSLNIFLPLSILASQQTFTYSGSLDGTIDPGDLLTIENEKVRVISHNILSDPPTITVTRGHAGTVNTIHPEDSSIDKVDRVDIFQFGGVNPGVTRTDNSRIYVRETGEVLYTDKFGTVYNSVSCSISFITIDEP